MIENDRQLEITEAHLINFKKSLSLLENDLDYDELLLNGPLLKDLHRRSLISKIEDFEYEIEEYKKLINK